MKIEKSCATAAGVKKLRVGLRRILCLLVLVAAVVAAVGAFASPRLPAVASAQAGANQGSMRLSAAAPANIILVTNTNDSGPGSLRDALAAASDGDTIDATGVSGTILLTSGELEIIHGVTINGPGANNLAVDGNGTDRVFYINPKTVSIDGLTIGNGASDFGGGIYNFEATLTVSNCIISGNSGGGISNFFGTLTVSNCTISNNFFGSGIYFDGTYVTLTVSNSIISGNSADYGGGISSSRGLIVVSNSTISGNSANYGGGISNSAGLTVSNSTISGNSASYGGGIYNVGGRVTISNSTLSGNLADVVGGGVHNSGSSGDFLQPGVLSVTNSTISGNSATGNGGGIYNNHCATQYCSYLTLGSTILNAGASGGTIFNNGGRVTSLGYNLASDAGGGVLTGPGDQINTDPLLGPLQDNGGPTFTHELLPGSPAIDAGDPSFTPPPSYDQRGCPFGRVFNGRIDVGSLELQLSPSRPCPTPRPRPTPHPRPTL
jgi:hypothetical protein